MDYLRVLYFVIVFLIVACTSKPFEEDIPLSPELERQRMIECDSILESLSSRNADTFGIITKIPVTLDECYTALDTIFTNDLKEWVICLPASEFGVKMHFGLGLHIRNNWNLWKGGELSSFLASKGIDHPDNMSGIILYLYHRKLRGKQYDIDKFLEYQKKQVEKENEGRNNNQ